MVKRNAIGKFGLPDEKEFSKLLEPVTHIYHSGARCETDTIGHETPGHRSPLELVAGASNGVIPP
jgi:hypothetical protein